ncbi:HNH endonuclease [Azospirillum melinis]
MKSLYEENVVKSKGQARKIYDEIYVSAHGNCPYCGEIGDVETLDHYLPKAYFPSFAVLPVNLIPSCNKCNKGTSGAFPLTPDLQPINPYLDDDHFFLERWITAEVLRIDPIVARFKAEPPTHWSDTDKSRAKQHFIDYKLQERFSKQVSGEVGPLLTQRKITLRDFSEDQFRDHLNIIVNDEDLLLNGWKRTLYLALCESDWFCKVDFNSNWLVG